MKSVLPKHSFEQRTKNAVAGQLIRYRLKSGRAELPTAYGTPSRTNAVPIL
jgi:hypothetical protein